MRGVIRVLTAAAVFAAACDFGWASYAIYIGKNLTADGSVFLAGYGDEPSSHWLEVVPRREWPSGASIQVGATAASEYPGTLIAIPQVRKTAKYITVNYSSFAGFPAPLTNGGLNEHLVAARDVASKSREELRRLTPKPQKGLNYSDLSRIVMERAKTAREAVEIVGALINQYGYATYGGNSHLFADAEEGWILIEYAGGQGLWVAQRLGPDDIRVSRPGYIGEIPLDYQNHPGYRGSPNLISFAVERGWYDPKSGAPFDVYKVYGGYGDGKMRHEHVVLIEERLRQLAGKIRIEDVIAAVRTTDVTLESAGYGQVAHLRKTPHPALGVLWVAAATPVTAPFVPFRLGVNDVPAEFKRHRYLTAGEADIFMDPAWQGIESTRSAFYAFKRLFYLTSEHRDQFLPEVTASLTAFEAGLIAAQPGVERTALKLYQAGEPDLAGAYLTYYSNTEAMNGLRLAEALSVSIEARTKAQFGTRQPQSTDPSKE